MFDFRNAIQNKYHCSNVTIQITNDSLAVVVVNSPYEDSSNTIKLQLAKEIGIMSKQYIKSPMTKGTLSFKNEHNYLVVNTSNISNFPMFPEKR